MLPATSTTDQSSHQMATETNIVETSIQHKLRGLPKSKGKDYRLYQVPEHLREVNRECYEPSVVSIGPIYYYKRNSLKYSQELKLRHLECFLELGVWKKGYAAYSLGNFIDFLKGWEEEARLFYEDNISLSSDEFVEMMMVDAAFIIYFMMLRSPDFPHREDPMDKMMAWALKVLQDVFLADNQLPFFLLNELYLMAFGSDYPQISFRDITCNFIGESSIPGWVAARTVGKVRVRDAEDIKDLVDFLRVLCYPSVKLGHDQNPKDNEERFCDENKLCCLPLKRQGRNLKDEKKSQFPPTATALKATGVKFLATDGKNLLDIKYRDGVLQIPTLTIEDTTETILRSLMFSEQCHYYEDSYFTHYVFFLDALINTSEDVQVLIKHGIIEHWLGSDDEVATMINRITRNVAITNCEVYYSQVSRDLHAHVTTRWNKWRAILKTDYFNHPWSTLSVVYLVVLLVLTVLQVYTGFTQ
ncbi:UPF0481 protein At3g47200-like [Beta vulgaris subsp. vulgaris]|uniref:UPF0481 protein At3g47200-like n=1 Tax=Beta vulgaris subsp. vulgaris TaxID=3555 RepID=UPI00254664C8|nr:UPF0481 protein At3g47200-like [Beta vulgaris subsp. vulgaris]